MLSGADRNLHHCLLLVFPALQIINSDWAFDFINFRVLCAERERELIDLKVSRENLETNILKPTSFQMSSSDESDYELVRVKSLPNKVYSSAPHNMEFKLKIKPRAGKSGKIKLGYTLKKDQELPYQPDFEGTLFSFFTIMHKINEFSCAGCNHKVIFGQNLKPSMGDKWAFEQKEGWWIFTGQTA